MKGRIFKYSLVVTCMIAAGTLFAQPNGGGGGQGQGGQPQGGTGGTGGPVDDGAIVLLIGVSGYLYARLNKQKHTQAIDQGNM